MWHGLAFCVGAAWGLCLYRELSTHLQTVGRRYMCADVCSGGKRRRAAGRCKATEMRGLQYPGYYQPLPVAPKYYTFSSSSSSIWDSHFFPFNRCRFSLTKTSFSKLSAVRDDLLGLRMSDPMLKSLSTAAEEGRGELYLINRSDQASLWSRGN
ncbi:hypothetical protein GWK47_030038 [Chionoecetes opilio]|uniref:Uncharacterized protein n=1 Tax=Chionoecetes opilio TaxID=41210 RepID=A0A8J5D5C8_CHIOP|nr:hypothetical protein GWK47_030038 [Chionoecetes opilio]